MSPTHPLTRETLKLKQKMGVYTTSRLGLLIYQILLTMLLLFVSLQILKAFNAYILGWVDFDIFFKSHKVSCCGAFVRL